MKALILILELVSSLTFISLFAQASESGLLKIEDLTFTTPSNRTCRQVLAPYYGPSDADIFNTAKADVWPFLERTVDGIFEITHAHNHDRTEATIKEHANIIEELLIVNPEVENSMVRPNIKILSNSLNLNLSRQEIAQKILQAVVDGRYDFFRSQLKAKPFAFQNPNAHMFTRQDTKNFEVYTFKIPLTQQQFLKKIPDLAKMWPVSYDVTATANVVPVLLFEISDIPGTYLFFFKDRTTMNAVWKRASHYIEAEPVLIDGKDLFAVGSAGHDLKGTAIKTFISAIHQESRLPAPHDGLNSEIERRLTLEREFFDQVVNPLIDKNENETVFLAAALAGGPLRALDTQSHELWHALFFLNPQFRNLCYEFYEKHLSAADVTTWEDILASVNYNPADHDLMINEFQAYMLQTYHEVNMKNPFYQKVTPYRQQVRSQLVDFLNKHGYNIEK